MKSFQKLLTLWIKSFKSMTIQMKPFEWYLAVALFFVTRHGSNFSLWVNFF